MDMGEKKWETCMRANSSLTVRMCSWADSLLGIGAGFSSSSFSSTYFCSMAASFARLAARSLYRFSDKYQMYEQHTSALV